ncbi:SDR family NAD(P)-dependent oxidoreductase [Pseudogemmobacter sonorensis]|uniref:SDR family NAD(P)-dependent oxidoreductase n=1 Tax=Pseudogemmobacter sonorensis TaxID=2989681 RepID=UPI0036AEAE2C
MPTVLITGANRGIGLEFARQYADAGWEVIAANRTPLKPMDFVDLGFGLREIRYDATNDASAAELATRLRGHAIDVLILNAGISPDEGRAPEEMSPEQWEEVLLTNTYAPLHLAALLEPNLRAGGKKTVAAVSSLAASATLYDVPRQFAYRSSKAALNQMMRNLSVEWKSWGCISLMLRPGRVKTRMNPAGILSARESVTGMRRIIDNATPDASGLHWGYDGVVVPW